jgi:hypothetical protein
VGSHVLDAAEEALTTAAANKDGTLTADEIRATLDHLRSAPRGLWQFYKTSFSSCLAASKVTPPERYERRDLFLRLLTATFEHRFPDRIGPDDDGPILSRTILSPFEAAVTMMLGRDDVQADQEACEAIYDELLRERGDDISWGDYLEDPHAQAILLRTSAAVARHFGDFGSRKAWFVDVLKNNQAPGENEAEITEADFALLFTCLFDACRELLENGPPELADVVEDDGRKAIVAMTDHLAAYGLGRYARPAPS